MKNCLVLLGCLFSSLTSLASTPRACKIKDNIKTQINVIASNLANINTTRTPEGGPYQRKELICKAEFCVVVARGEFVEKYDPAHPDADSGGYVRLPKIDSRQEMDAMIEASQKYETAEKDCLAQSNLQSSL